MSEQTERGLVQVQIVNYVNWQSTISCIESIKQQTYDNHRLIVIENASPNDSLRQLKDYDPTLSILKSGKNLGWGAGLNLGFFNHGFDTNPEFFLTVNSDVVLEPDCLSKLVRTIHTSQDCAIVSPVIYEEPNSDRMDNVGFNLSYKYLVPFDLTKVTGSNRHWSLRGSRKVTWVSDTVALMRRSAILEAGGYDEQYFMYGQMTDLGYRLRQLGYGFRVNYDAIAYHSGRGSSGGKLSGFSLYYKLRNWCIFQRKHFGALHMPYTLLWTLGISLVYSVRVTFQGEPHLISDILRGVRDGLTQNCGATSTHDDQQA